MPSTPDAEHTRSEHTRSGGTMADTTLYFEDVKEGDEAPELRHVLTRTDLVAYAGASGDFNPMHHDEVKAKAAGQPSVFGHGMFSMGLLGTALTDYVGVGNVTPLHRSGSPGRPGRTRSSVGDRGHREAHRGRRPPGRPGRPSPQRRRRGEGGGRGHGRGPRPGLTLGGPPPDRRGSSSRTGAGRRAAHGGGTVGSDRVEPGSDRGVGPGGEWREHRGGSWFDGIGVGPGRSAGRHDPSGRHGSSGRHDAAPWSPSS